MSSRSASLRKSGDGFTLVEILIVMAVLGILSTVSLTSWRGMKVMAMSAEAKNALGHIRNLEEAYRFEYFMYSKSIDKLSFVQPEGARYSYSIADANSDSCTIVAEGKAGSPVEGNVWVLEIINDVPFQPRVQ